MRSIVYILGFRSAAGTLAAAMAWSVLSLPALSEPSSVAQQSEPPPSEANGSGQTLAADDVMNVPLSKSTAPPQPKDQDALGLGIDGLVSEAPRSKSNGIDWEGFKRQQLQDDKVGEARLAAVIPILAVLSAVLYFSQSWLGLRRLAAFVGLVPGAALGVFLANAATEWSADRFTIAVCISLAVSVGLTFLLLLTLAAAHWIKSGFVADRSRVPQGTASPSHSTADTKP